MSPLVAFALIHEAIPTSVNAPAPVSSPVAAPKKGLKERFYQKKDEVKGRVKEAREKFGETVEKKRAQFEKLAPERQEQLKKKLGEKRAAAIERFFQNTVRKFVNAITRLETLADRIGTRLDQAEANGKDVSALRDSLAKARMKIDEAERALEDAKAKYAEAVKNPDFKASFQKVKEVVGGVAQRVKDAHRALVEVVRSSKGLGGGNAGVSPASAASSPAATPATLPLSQ